MEIDLSSAQSKTRVRPNDSAGIGQVKSVPGRGNHALKRIWTPTHRWAAFPAAIRRFSSMGRIGQNLSRRGRLGQPENAASAQRLGPRVKTVSAATLIETREFHLVASRASGYFTPLARDASGEAARTPTFQFPKRNQPIPAPQNSKLRSPAKNARP